jgi:AraC family transcriptional regulator, regulatory protein of adaptative response / methylphosphotriester-DNA alkyltransferase methyltransferase
LAQAAYNNLFHPIPGSVRISLRVRQSTRTRRRTLFEEALDAIRRDYSDESLSLADVAHTIATSRRQLQRVLSEHDTSFRAELQRVRMTRAAMLLRDPALPVAAVARAVGYRQAAQFSKAFRRHYGRPPSAVRRSASVQRVAA